MHLCHLRTRFVEVYLVENGLGPVPSSSYNGVYVLEEKIKLGNDRVDAPDLDPGENSEPAVTGAYLLKIDRPDPSSTFVTRAGLNTRAPASIARR